MCKAAGKEYKSWRRAKNTDPYLESISQKCNLCTSELIHRATGGNYTTWVHPYVAINIAQWCSPHFSAQVSIWVFEIIATGKVDSSNPTDFETLKSELEKKIKEKEVIQMQLENTIKEKEVIEKQYKKKIKRKQYSKGNVIYILQSENHKESGIFKIGITSDMTGRLSNFNTSDEHEVIFMQECYTIEYMEIIEESVHLVLNHCRIQSNRERFQLPEEKDIDYFITTIKNIVQGFPKPVDAIQI